MSDSDAMNNPKLIRSNRAMDSNGVVHTITWDGTANWGERTHNLTATCSCGWQSDSGSEASGRREFTHHIIG